MKIAMTMPQFGESITQAVIVRWLKREGDTVREGEPLVEMETEKSVFAHESPFAGSLLKILGAENTEVNVGVEIAQFEVSEADGKKYLGLGVANAVSGGPAVEAAPAASPPPVVVAAAPKVSSVPLSKDEHLKLSPLVRALIKDYQLTEEQIQKITPSGFGGRITKDDVLKFVAEAKLGRQTSGIKSDAGMDVIPLAPIRSRIAERMVLSKMTIPHAACSIEVDVTAIVEWRRQHNEGFKKKEGFGISYLPFTIMAAVQVIKDHPIFNASFKEKDGKKWIEQYHAVNAGIALATDNGLMVPNIKNAAQKSFLELAREINRLVMKGMRGELTVDELTGGTFTFNNSGALGAVRSQQVIPPPQSAILAVNRIVRRPWVVTGPSGAETIEPRSIVNLDLAFDHRIIDGDHAVRFLVAIRDGLEGFKTQTID